MSPMTMFQKRITIQRQRGGGVAECEGCDRLHPDSTRERCRVHADRTGHTVRYVIEDVTIYKRVDVTVTAGGAS